MTTHMRLLEADKDAPCQVWIDEKDVSSLAYRAYVSDTPNKTRNGYVEIYPNNGENIVIPENHIGEDLPITQIWGMVKWEPVEEVS